MHPTREAWLEASIPFLRGLIVGAGGPKFKDPRVSVGFCSTGRRSRRAGECWVPQKDGRSQIFIRPEMDQPVPVLDLMAHELIHASLPGAGHGPAFKKVALGIGLTGKMRSTVAGPELKAKLVKLAKRLGKFPHHALVAGNEVKKQTTRMRKYVCPDCEQIVRAATDDLKITCVLCDCEYKQA